MTWAVLIAVRQPQTITQHLALKCAFYTIWLLLLTCSNHLLTWKTQQRRCYQKPAEQTSWPRCSALGWGDREMQAQEDSVSGRWHGPRRLGSHRRASEVRPSQLCRHLFSDWGRHPRGRVGATCVCLLSKCTRVCAEQGQKESPLPGI